MISNDMILYIIYNDSDHESWESLSPGYPRPALQTFHTNVECLGGANANAQEEAPNGGWGPGGAFEHAINSKVPFGDLTVCYAIDGPCLDGINMMNWWTHITMVYIYRVLYNHVIY